MPSPVKDRPGLVIRDPYGYSDATLIVPPALMQCLAFFDGEHSALDLKAFLVKASGQLDVSALQQNLENTLRQAGFLEDEIFAAKKRQAEEAFRGAPVRLPARAPCGWPGSRR